MDAYYSDGNATSFIIDLALEESRKDLQDNEVVLFWWYFGEFWRFFKGLGRCFYLVSPSDTSFKSAEEVPNYFRQVCHF